MSEDTTTPETPAAPAADAPSTPVTEPNVVPVDFTTPESSAPESDLPPPTDENTIDLATVQFDEVFKDLVQSTKQFSFRLLVTCGLLEQIYLRDNPPAAPADEASPAQDA